MGSKGNKQTTTSTQSYTPDPRISQAAGQAISGAQSAAQLPFQMPAAPVAGFSPFQEQAFNQIQGAQGMSLPYFDDARQFMRGSASPISEQDVQQYYNPMAQSVTNQLQNIFGQQNRSVRDQLTGAAGGVGASRIAVGQGNLANQQTLAAGQIYAGLYDKALQAAQQQKQMMAGAGYGMGQLGPAAQASYLQGTGALGAAGAQQQALSQAQQNALYQQRLAEIAYPFQTPQYLAGIAGGLAPALGGTTQGQSTTTTPTPSPLNQILGIGGALLGTALGGPMGGMMGGSLGKGAGSAIGSTFGATDMGGGFGYGSYGGTPVPTFFRRGGKVIDLGPDEYSSGGSAYGRIAEQRFANSPVGNPYASSSGEPEDSEYAEGGEVDEGPSLPGTRPMPMDTTSIVPKIPLRMGAGHAGAKLNLNPPQQRQQSGSPLGQVASTAMKFLPMLMAAQGGAVNPFDAGQGFQEGGFADDIYPDEAGLQPPDTFAERFAPSKGSLEGSELQGMDAPMGNTNPHWSMADLGNRARDFYGEKAQRVASAMEPDPQSPLNVQRYIPSAAKVFAPETASAAAPPQNPMTAPDERGFQPPPDRVPMPRERPDIAGPSRFSPQMPPLTPQQIAQETFRAAQDRGIPPQIALALVKQESGFRNIRGAAGEYGPAQIMPGTARELGLKDPGNTYLNIHAGMDYLKRQYDKFGNWPQAIAAYNAGPNAVASGRIPASTQGYVRNILGGENVDMSALSNREGVNQPRNPFALANQDMTLGDYLRSPQRPYPDSLQRDWGQNLARSPWSALITGGARMAQTVGPVGSALGAGIEAGMGTLQGQRKELRTEEDMNMKADALFQHAKQHLDKYQRMTPYEEATKDWRLSKLEAPTGTAGWKYRAWLSAHPGDEAGALEFAGGRRQVPEPQLLRWASDQALKEKRDDPSIDIKERTRELFEIYKQTTPSGQKQTPVNQTKESKAGTFKKIKDGPDSDPTNWEKVA